MKTTYCGRFAPTPSGHMHMGSLLAALCSYLDAKANDGKWLVRIEDVDVTRCKPEFATSILETLKVHGMVSDKPIIFQSKRSEIYAAVANIVIEKGLSFSCTCTKSSLKFLPKNEITGEYIYNSKCIKNAEKYKNYKEFLLKSKSESLRLIARNEDIEWYDYFRKTAFVENVKEFTGDFVLQRADRCFTYAFAVVVDDYLQHVTHVVRGEDIGPLTHRQLFLQRILGYSEPFYAHFPLLKDEISEQKLSKQNMSPSVDNFRWKENLVFCANIIFLGKVEFRFGSFEDKSPEQLLAMLVEKWKEQKIIDWGPF